MPAPPTCASCNYNLSGLPPRARCPECGATYDAIALQSRPKMREPGACFYLALAVALLPVSAPWLIPWRPHSFDALWQALPAWLVFAALHVAVVALLVRIDARRRGGPVPPIPIIVAAALDLGGAPIIWLVVHSARMALSP